MVRFPSIDGRLLGSFPSEEATKRGHANDNALKRAGKESASKRHSFRGTNMDCKTARFAGMAFTVVALGCALCAGAQDTSNTIVLTGADRRAATSQNGEWASII